MRIGILAVQGDVRENISAMRAAMKKSDRTGYISRVRVPSEIKEIDALVMPGGESTTMGRICQENGSLDIIKSRIESGMPVLGICAGLVLLSKKAPDIITGETGQPLLGALDVDIRRNSFGRQSQSFESVISLEKIGIPKFNGVFIRAPSVYRAGEGVEILSSMGDHITAVKKNKIMGTSFHPELAGDTAIHRHFLGLL